VDGDSGIVYDADLICHSQYIDDVQAPAPGVSDPRAQGGDGTPGAGGGALRLQGPLPAPAESHRVS